MKTTQNDNGTATVVLPADKPEGTEWVAAFRQPLPLKGMANLCKAIAECYGNDAKLTPTGDWLAVSGVLCNAGDRPAEPEQAPAPAPADSEQDKTGSTPYATPVAFRVCEIQPLDPTDGGSFTAFSPLEAAAMLLSRHGNLSEYPTLYVWPDGEEPTPFNVMAIPMAEVENARAGMGTCEG